MRIKRTVLLPLMGVIALGCSNRVTRQQRIVAEEAVRGRFQVWTRALNNRSLDTVAAMYLNDENIYVIDPGGQRFDGWEGVQQGIRDFYGSINYMNFVPQDPTIDVIAIDVTTTAFRHSTTIDRPRGRLVTAGHGLLVWAKDPSDGLWRIRSQIISQNASYE